MERSNVAESENQQQSEKAYFSPALVWDQLFEASLVAEWEYRGIL